jgi:hypothetical protein
MLASRVGATGTTGLEVSPGVGVLSLCLVKIRTTR